MNILFASAEVSPFAKVGGLADVAGSLPKSISSLGHDVRVIMPLYGSINIEKYHLKKVPNSEIYVFLGGRAIYASLYEGKLPNSDVTIYFVDNNEYFGYHSEVYPKNMYYRFEQERFVLFSLAVLKLTQKIGFKPDIIHCNDWHTAPIPVYLKTRPWEFGYFARTATVFSIHNLAYQGLYSRDILDFAGLSQCLFDSQFLEFYNDVNWMKGGILFADELTTVSEKYAEEIQTPEYGEKLDGLLRWQVGKLSGILNGIDVGGYNPETDPAIPANYSSDDLSGKKICKKELQKEFQLAHSNYPLIGIVSRLVNQKGFDLIESISYKLAEMKIQLIVLGSGQYRYEQFFNELARVHKNVGVYIGFDAKLAQRIYAGSDMFLMPSKFEPCGLGQLIALKYGTIPIVRNTGGLADTVVDYSKDKHGNGFKFNNYSADELLDAVTRAVSTYQNSKNWNNLVKQAMACDFSWPNSAKKYLNLYERALRRVQHA